MDTDGAEPKACEEPNSERSQRRARLALFAAGMSYQPEPWQVVARMAEARRAIVELRWRGSPLDGWLGEEVRVRGLRENAAVIAAMEVPEYRERVAREYVERYSERAGLVHAFAESFEPGQPAG